MTNPDDELVEAMVVEFEDVAWWYGDKTRAMRDALAVARATIRSAALDDAQNSILNERPFPCGRLTERGIGYKRGLLAAHSSVAKLKEPTHD